MRLTEIHGVRAISLRFSMMAGSSAKRIMIALAAFSLLQLHAASAAPSTPPGQPLDEKAEFDALAKDIARFEDATREYKSAVQHVIQQEYQEKRRRLMEKYQSSIDVEEKSERTYREQAIALFEAFLQKYPTDSRWTPDAMFRLAELYFEKSNEEYLAATTNAPAQAVPNYQKTVDLYRDLIIRFPNYRLIDGAYYLMGWCLGEMNQERESLQAMRALVCANRYKPLDPPESPKPYKGRSMSKGTMDDIYAGCEPLKKDSRFLPEAWTRVGENHFDNSELEFAIAAYGRVLQFKDSAYYDKALYKLAWSYYRADNYPKAIDRFDDLVVFSDKKKAESGSEGSDLRAEAIQYLAVSFSEKDWDGDSLDDQEGGLEKLEKYYRGREKEPHVREIYARLGDIYFDQTDYFRAIVLYKKSIEKWPFDPSNPKLQDRVIMAFERQRDFGNALKERDVLAKNYTRGSEWYQYNRDNKQAIEQAEELAELALISAAVNHHKAAQDLKKLAAASKKPDPKLFEAVGKEYALAANAYQKYLEQYPNSKNAYEYGYSYAETLYFSGRFLEAAQQYEKIRDSSLDTKYAEDSAFNVIKSYEKYLELEAQAGRYQEPPLPTDGKTVVPVVAQPVPDVVNKLKAAYDHFVERVPNSGRVTTMTYKAAEIDYRYLHWNDARPRFEKIVEKYCKDDIGANAGNALLASYAIEKNLDKIEEWANKLKAMNCGSAQVASKNSAELGKLSLGVRFKKADKLFEEKKYEEAAALYVQIVDADPKGEDADKALNNAAVCYENVKRYGAATKLYERIVTDYPSSKFVDDALFRTAVSYQKYFEFDKAVVSYQRLAEDSRFAASTHRTDALYNAAVLLENDQNYGKAAELFKRYAADKSVKPEDASEAYFRSATIYQKMKDDNKALSSYREYVRTYGKEPKNNGRVLEAYFREAEIYSGQRDRKSAEDMYRKVVTNGTSAAPASDAAEFPAHAVFLAAEQQLADFQKLKIGGGKDFEPTYKKLTAEVARMVELYNKVIAYRRATWTLAAYFRIGFVYEHLSKSLAATLQLPCPAEIMKKFKQEGCDVYAQELQKKIEEMAGSVDEEVVKRYGVTLDQAGKLGVSNEWTRLARQRANAYRPDQFPLIKDERIAIGMENP